MTAKHTTAPVQFFVGGYTQPTPPAHPQGINRCVLEPSGAMRVLDTEPNVSQPSYLARRGDRLFAVKETSAAESPAVNSFAFDEAGRLTHVQSAPVPGDAPCHLATSPDGRFLAVACYSSGNVILYALEPDGTLRELHAVQHEDEKNPAREPRAHQTVFGPDGQTLFVTDLGLDEIRSYRFGEGRLEPQAVTALAPGSGPRHLAFHPSGLYAFTLGELDSSLTLLRHKEGMLEPLEALPLLLDPSGQNAAAAVRVAPSGRFVYASNRDLDAQGNDGIAVFAFDEAAEQLTRTAFVSSGGNLPRDFALTPDGQGLVVAHQGSNTLVSFWVDEASGALTATGETLELHQPVCVLMP